MCCVCVGVKWNRPAIFPLQPEEKKKRREKERPGISAVCARLAALLGRIVRRSGAGVRGGPI